MTINERIAALAEISPQTVKGNFTFDEFKFEILNVLNTKEPNYEPLISIFHETQTLLDMPVYNIINERISFKAFFLSIGYDFDTNFVNTLLCLMPLVQLDYELGKLFEDNDFYNYLEKTYWQHRRNVEINLSKVLDTIKDIDFNSYINELQGGIEQLNKMAK